MYCSAAISRKIKYLSFLAAVGVVCLHTNPIESVENAPGWVVALAGWWSGFNDWAVPFFFVVSGFFFDRGFFCHVERENFWLWYRSLVGKKWKTLIIPYLLWGAVFGGLLWTPLWMLTNMRSGLPLFANTFLGEPHIGCSVDKLLGVFCNGPANPTLWFVRVLIVAFLLAPFLIGLRKCSRWLLAGLSLFAVCLFTPVSRVTPLETLFTIGGISIEFKVQGLAWFGVGMSISAFRLEEMKMPICLTVFSFVGWCVLHILGDVKFFPFLLIPALWGAMDWMLPHFPEKVPEWMTLTFWLYCCHGPLSGWIGGGYRAIVGKGVAGYFIQLATLWLVVICVCYALAYVVKRWFPKLYNLLSGGRG